MYKVPLEIPKYCNKCPFGRCSYSLPLPRERWRDREFSGLVQVRGNKVKIHMII